MQDDMVTSDLIGFRNMRGYDEKGMLGVSWGVVEYSCGLVA
jgi:hypothetical protein